MRTSWGPGQRIRRRQLAVAAIVVVLVLVAVPAGLMERRLRPARMPVTDDPSRYGLASEPVAFTSLADGLTLRGWYLRAARPTGRTLVVAPGIDANREMNGITLAFAPALLDHGWNVLAFDLRSEGTSDGDTISFGWRERWDVLGAVAEARRRGAGHVAVLGFSLGGAASILAAAESPTIEALVTDSAFARLDVTLRRGLERDLHLPPPAASYGLVLYRLLSGKDPAEVAPVEAIAAIAPRPVLLIHGEADATVPPVDVRELGLAAGATASTWMVPGAGHTLAYRVDPEGYARRVLAFLDAAIPR